MASSTDYRIDTNSPVASDLLFWSVIGHEALSRPSVYELTVLSANPDIQAADILGRSFDVVIGFEDAEGGTHERHCQGVAVRFARWHRLGRYHEYRIELRSWFWLLQKRRNSRILGDDKDEGKAKNALEILDIVLENSPVRAIQKVKRDGLGKHEARGYTVQYQESDYHYLSRLLEDEGIYYWFDAHTAPGTLCLADNSSVAHDPLPVADVLRHVPGGASEERFNEVWSWESERKLDTGWFDSRDSNYLKIRTTLGALGGDLEAHELADFEEFEFPGGYQDQAQAEVVLGNRVDELRSRRERNWALTGWPDVAPGRSFSYENDPDITRNGKYLIGSCIVVAVHPGHESVPRPPTDVWALRRMLDRALEDDAVNADTADTLRRLVDSSPSLRELSQGTRAFLITTWPASVNYKPARLTPRVRMPGPQSAIVVGPKGEEIPENGEDLYVDAYGRVKVFFHWNRYEKDKKDFDGQKWSAWLRVSQPWAGKKWGGYFAPRIGQEVIVDFLDGDPDRPLIVGRVYNDDQPIPYASPTQSGFKTRSTPKGNSTNYNEIMFEDRKGQENLNIHAERNMSRSVEVDDSTSVGHDQNISVKNYQWTTVGKYRSVVVEDGNESYVVNGHRSTYVQLDDGLTVDGCRSIIVDKGQNTTITTGEHKLVVAAGNKNSFVTGDQLTWVSAGYTLSSMTAVINIGAALKISATDTTFVSKGKRDDFTSGAHTVAAGDVTLAATSGKVDVFSAGAINLTSQSGVNTTTLGDLKTGITGSTSSFELGTSLKTSISASVSTKIAASLSNEISASMSNMIGIAVSNKLAISISNTAGPDLKGTLLKKVDAACQIFNPGAGAGAGDAGSAAVVEAGKSFATAMGAIAAAAGVGGLIASAVQVNAAVDDEAQKEADAESRRNDAVKKLEALRTRALEAGLAELGDKLGDLSISIGLKDVSSSALRDWRTLKGAVEGATVGAAVAGPVGAVAGVVTGGVLENSSDPAHGAVGQGFDDPGASGSSGGGEGR